MEFAIAFLAIFVLLAIWRSAKSKKVQLDLPEPAPETFGLKPPEREVILQFARGKTELREEAIAIFRRNLRLVGPRGTIEMEFMAEIDHPSPDFNLRDIYRRRLLGIKPQA